MRRQSCQLTESFRAKKIALGTIVLGSALALTHIQSHAQSIPLQADNTTNNNLAAGPKKEPSDMFFQAHLQLTKGNEANVKGNYKQAWKNYSSALFYYQNLKLTHRSWKPVVVDYRIKNTTELLKNIKPKVQLQLKKAQELLLTEQKLDLDTPLYNVPPELISIAKKIKNLQLELDETKKSYHKKQLIQQAHLTAAEGQLKLWANKNQKNPKIVAQLEQKIKQATAVLESNNVYKKRDEKEIKNHITRLNKELAKHTAAPLKADLKRHKEDLAERNEELRVITEALVKSQQEQTISKRELQKKGSELTKAQAENTRLAKLLKEQQGTSTKVVKALYAKIEAAEKREQNLTKKLNDLKVHLADISSKLDEQLAQNKELKEKLQVVTAEKERLSELMLANPDERVKKIAKQNLELIQELKEANDAVKRISRSQAGNHERMLSAERNLVIAKKRIVDSQEQSLRDAKRIKTLQKQLLTIKSNSSNALSSGNLSPEQREENEILRKTAQKLIARQIAQEKKLSLLKEQILIENPSPIVKALIENNLNEKELQLSNKEKELIAKRPALDGTIQGMKRRLSEAETRNTMARVKNEVQTIHRVVEGLIMRDRLEAAKDLLNHANEIQPNDFPTLMNLGSVTMKMRDLDGAEQHFRDGIVMKQNNPYAHYMLGLCLYEKSKPDLAEKSLAHSLDLDGAQEKANFYLGAIAGEGGRLDTAENYFKRAIRINPNLAEAYYALSVNSLIKKQIGRAQDYYQEALQKGLSPVPAHAENLGLPH